MTRSGKRKFDEIEQFETLFNLPLEVWQEIYCRLTLKELWTLHFVCRFFFGSIPLVVRRKYLQRWQGRFITFHRSFNISSPSHIPIHWPLHIVFHVPQFVFSLGDDYKRADRANMERIASHPDVNVQRWTFMDCCPPSNSAAYKDAEIVLVDRARFPKKVPDENFEVPQEERLDNPRPRPQPAFQGAKRIYFVNDLVNIGPLGERHIAHNAKHWKVEPRTPCVFNNTNWRGAWYLTDITDVTIHSIQQGLNEFVIDRDAVPMTEPIRITIVVHNLSLLGQMFANCFNFTCRTNPTPVIFHFKFAAGFTFDYSRHCIANILFTTEPASITFEWPKHVSQAAAPFMAIRNKLRGPDAWILY